jgi:phosphoenolpyruvate carboxylase
MRSQSTTSLQQFKNQVGIKYQLYNSLFTSLPFHRIEKTGILLSLLLSNCEEGYRRKMSPLAILEEFFSRHTQYGSERERTDLLFRFVQYVERQVVLFDALEDAAFSDVNDMSGAGTLKQLVGEMSQVSEDRDAARQLADFTVRLVLTAHPTQFYPGSVLGIINDLSKAVAGNEIGQINTYLQQLGKTPFFKKTKPTPYDEAVSLIWYLENVFYPASGRIMNTLRSQFPDMDGDEPLPIRMGFWPGGDRDGNPFVTADVTLKVAEALRGSIIKCYYLEVRRLKRRLTFEGVESRLQELESKLYENIFIPGRRTELSREEILTTLQEIRETLLYQHNGLFIGMVDSLLSKVRLFGLFFASLDVRQESGVHGRVMEALSSLTDRLPAGYASLSQEQRMTAIADMGEGRVEGPFDDPQVKDAMETVDAIGAIQRMSGEAGASRYIISQTGSALDLLEVYALFRLRGWKTDDIAVDIVPLFETVDDLMNAESVMAQLYANPLYSSHLKRRGMRQTIMLGFSDGTKDGGYLMANYGIYKAKVALTRISREHGVDVVFFDGRGGPPARGGGKTHRFYASMGRDIANREIQLTIQGQTISSNFGTVDAAQYNIEQLIHAGVSNALSADLPVTLPPEQRILVEEMADKGYAAYKALREHPRFMEYLEQVSPLRFYAETNIGSRPAKRGGSSRLTLKDLRAIPYVGAWSQLKQNVTGYYGVGTALRVMDEAGRWEEVRSLYRGSAFFKTLLDNCEMAMTKCFFPLTEYLGQDPRFGELWNLIRTEYELTRRYLLQLSGHSELMGDHPVERLSVQMRERIVLPLTTIQQYAIAKVRESEEAMEDSERKKVYEKLVMRCSFGIINAARNSA